MIHGGGFAAHDRNFAPPIKVAKMLATQGYVVVSIDYRLLGQSNQTHANLVAAYDARAAVRWLRANAAKLRVDPMRIGAFGGSAGGMTVAVLVTYAGEGDNLDHAGFPSGVAGGVSLSGFLLPELESAITQNQPPYLDFHGCEDPIVNFSLAVETNRALTSAVADSEIYPFPGAGHVPYRLLEQQVPWQTLSAFFADALDLAHAECPR